jgi:hypothetical protein
MGSIIELNDTLQLIKEQGFPAELVWEIHQKKPFTTQDFADQVFEFKGKPRRRVFHDPPVRNFLVENREGKWLYWARIDVWDVVYDPETQTTSGKFKIIYLYTPDEMKVAHRLIDGNPDTDFFGQL